MKIKLFLEPANDLLAITWPTIGHPSTASIRNYSNSKLRSVISLRADMI